MRVLSANESPKRGARGCVEDARLTRDPRVIHSFRRVRLGRDGAIALTDNADVLRAGRPGENELVPSSEDRRGATRRRRFVTVNNAVNCGSGRTNARRDVRRLSYYNTLQPSAN